MPMSPWRTSLALSALALLTQVFQLALQFAIARLYGTSAQVDAYAAAVTAPQLLSSLLLAASAQLIVPVLARALGSSKEEYARVRNGLLAWGLLIGVGGAALLGSFPEAVIAAIVPGLSGKARALAPEYLQWAAVALVPGAFSVYLTQTHNLRERFALPAILSLAGAALLPAGFILFHERAGFEVLLVLQVVVPLFQALFLVAGELGFLRGGLVLRHPLLREIAVSSLPVILVVISARVNLAVDRYFASFLTSGSLALLHYADRWVLLTQAVLSAPFVTVLYTRMARSQEEGESRRAGREAFSTMLYLGVALAAWTFLAAPDLAAALLSAGGKAPEGAPVLARALAAYSGVLVLGGFGSILVRAYYVRGRLWQAAFVAGVFPMVVNVILDALLVTRFGVVGLAAVTSLNALIGLPVAAWLLARYDPEVFGAGFWRSPLKALVGAVAAFLLAAGLAHLLVEGEGLRELVLRLGVLTATGGALYLLFTRLLGTDEAREILAVFLPVRANAEVES